MQSGPKEWTLDDLNFMSAMVNVIDTELKATARQEWEGELIDKFVQLLQKPAKELQL